MFLGGWHGRDRGFWFTREEPLERTDVLLHGQLRRFHLLGELGIKRAEAQSALGHRRDKEGIAGTGAQVVQSGARQQDTDGIAHFPEFNFEGHELRALPRWL